MSNNPNQHTCPGKSGESVCRKCGRYHDKVQRGRASRKYINPRAKNSNEREELENALVDIAKQKSLEIYRKKDVVSQRDQTSDMDTDWDSSEHSKSTVNYEAYGSRLLSNSKPKVRLDRQNNDGRVNTLSEYQNKRENRNKREDRNRHRNISSAVKITTRKFGDHESIDNVYQPIQINELGNADDVSDWDKVQINDQLQNYEPDDIDQVTDMTDIETESCDVTNTNSFEFDENQNQNGMSWDSRVNIIVGRGRKEVEGNMNLPLNPIFDFSYVMYVDESPFSDPDVQMKIEDIDFSQFGFGDNVTDIRIYFDWSSFYCTAMHNIAQLITRFKYEVGKSVKVYVPLYVEDKSLPGDVKRCVIDSPLYDANVRLSMVYGKYPLFNWMDQNRNDKLKEAVNEEMYILINNYVSD
jgi:hypothetical protein